MDVVDTVSSTVDEFRLIGGLRYRGNASWPFAELILSHDRLVVRLRSRLMRLLFGLWLPEVNVATSDLAAIEVMSGSVFGSRGIRILSDGQPRVIFWIRNQDQEERALAALEQRGVRLLYEA